MTDWSFSEQAAYENEREMLDEIVEQEHSRLATESDAHAEWHRNSGVPIGTPGCPQDACHADDYDDLPTEHETVPVRWKRLRSGGWGVTGPSVLLREGEQVAVTKRDGSTSTATVSRVLWSGYSREGTAISIASVRK